ncbi:metastasis suppressor protein 1 [Paragonimus westermani]|uniref:Metastasis suppressor protein 1 n=1 Tax=Paragonimus westermani TaxID=34504 RepID=A0A5J4NC10_9TREM|nr:metastasis suppressor protein 1 [Paragonimus westermani]
MLSELSTIDELVQSLAKAVKNPDQLMEDAESVLFRAGRGELSRSGNAKSSWYESDNSSGLIAAATAALFANHDHTRAGSSDTDSGRLTMDANLLERKPDDQLDNCSLSSSTQSQLNADGVGTYHDSNLPGQGNHNSSYRYLPVGDGTSLSLGGTSSHSSSESSGGNPGYGSTRISLGVHVMPGLTEPPNASGGSVPFRSFDSTIAYPKSGLGPIHNAGENPLATSCLLPTTTPHQVDMEETQFRTLCRPGHCRTSSANVLSTGIIMPQQSSQPDPEPHFVSTGSPLLTKSEASLIHLPNLNSRPTVDQNWLRDCDNNDEEDDDDDEEEHTSSAEDGNADDGDEVSGVPQFDLGKTQNQLGPNPVQTPDEEGGEYVEVQGEPNQCTPGENGSIGALLFNQAGRVGSGLSNVDNAASLNYGRHTISSAYERGGTAGNRSSLSNLAFNPPIGKSSSKDSGVDSSTVLYPNQALPPPVYTNLNQLAHAAQRKFSIPQIPSGLIVNGNSHIPAPSSPSRTIVDDRLTLGRHPTENTALPCSPSADRFQLNVYKSSTIQSLPHNPMTLASAPTLWSTGPTARRVTANSPGSSSTGIDPFSVELDELDKLGGAGSSNASSLTMASSTTSESQPSANGNRLASVNHAGRLGYCGDTQLSSEDAIPHPVSTSAGPVPTVGQTIAYQPATQPISVVQTGATVFPSSAPTTVSWYANAGLSHTTGPSASSEAASLMSELSSQLQQLATRTVSDSVPTRPVSADSQRPHTDDEFDLPPPPPDSMFNIDAVLSGESTAEHNTALLSALKRSVVDRASRITFQEDSTTSRPS